MQLDVKCILRVMNPGRRLGDAHEPGPVVGIESAVREIFVSQAGKELYVEATRPNTSKYIGRQGCAGGLTIPDGFFGYFNGPAGAVYILSPSGKAEVEQFIRAVDSTLTLT